jgi:hypothetical protein
VITAFSLLPGIVVSLSLDVALAISEVRQELASALEALDAKNAALEAKNTVLEKALAAKNADLEAVVAEMGTRLEALESSQSAGPGAPAGDGHPHQRRSLLGLGAAHQGMTRIGSGFVSTSFLNVTELHVHGNLLLHGFPVRFSSPTPAPTLAPTFIIGSCDDVFAHYGATSGVFSIDPLGSGGAFQGYCDFGVGDSTGWLLAKIVTNQHEYVTVQDEVLPTSANAALSDAAWLSIKATHSSLGVFNPQGVSATWAEFSFAELMTANCGHVGTMASLTEAEFYWQER